MPIPNGIPGTWDMVWNDEFDGTSIDTTKWFVVTGGTTRNDIPCFASNVAVSGGYLHLTLASSTSSSAVDSSAVRPGDTEPSDGYRLPPGGCCEASINFPGNGNAIYNWPAWWTVGGYEPAWPACGEYDIAEGLGNLECHVIGNGGLNAGSGDVPGTFANGFHTFGMFRDTGSNLVRFYYDGKEVFNHAPNDTQVPHGLLLNQGGIRFGTPKYPTVMLVDYVRAFIPGTPSESGPLPVTLKPLKTGLQANVVTGTRYNATLTTGMSVFFTFQKQSPGSPGFKVTLSTAIATSVTLSNNVLKSIIYFLYNTLSKSSNAFSFSPGLIDPGTADPGQPAGQIPGVAAGGMSTTGFLLQGRAKEYFVALSTLISVKSRTVRRVFRRLKAQVINSLPALFPVTEVITGPHGPLHIVLPGTCVIAVRGNFNVTLPPPATVITANVIKHKPLNLFLPANNVTLQGDIIRSGVLNIVITCRGMGLRPEAFGLTADSAPLRTVKKKITGDFRIPVKTRKMTVVPSPRGKARDSLSSVGSTEWRVVSNTQIEVNHLSTQYILVPVQADKAGESYNPTGDVVQFAFMPTTVQVPQVSDWVNGGWDVDSSNFLYPYSAKCLVGPAGAITLTVGTYVIYVKIIDSPEIPVLVAGQLIVS